MRNMFTNPIMIGLPGSDDSSPLTLERLHAQSSPHAQISTLPLSSPALASLEAVGSTHVGAVRQSNEDCFFLDTYETHAQDLEQAEDHLQGVFILCDGMGGHEQGEVASSMATFKLAQMLIHTDEPSFVTEIGLKASMYQTNQIIHQENLQQQQLGLKRMGTTAVVAAIQDRTVRIGHVGDSRCYRVTQSRGLEQLTLDHELGQVSIQRGIDPEIAYAQPNAYALTQALGPRPNHMISPDVMTLDLEEDSLFLLCSDGLSDNHLVESAWMTHLCPYLSPENSLASGVSQLVDLALQSNGHDNITVVLFRALI